MSISLFLPFIAYLCMLLGIGLASYRKQTSSVDFIVGNRSLNFWVTALSAHASDMSSWLFMAFPAAIYLGGLSQAWIAFGLLAGMFRKLAARGQNCALPPRNTEATPSVPFLKKDSRTIRKLCAPSQL